MNLDHQHDWNVALKAALQLGMDDVRDGRRRRGDAAAQHVVSAFHPITYRNGHLSTLGLVYGAAFKAQALERLAAKMS